MKHILTLLFLTMLLFPCPRASAADAMLENAYYFEGDTLYLTNDIVVTDWNGLKTKTSAFTEVVFGEGVTTIPEGMFQDSTQLLSVRFGSSVAEIGKAAFSGCSSLSEILWPASLQRIGASAFEGCAIEDLTLPFGVTSIEEFAFSRCSCLRTVVLPDSLVSLEYNFDDCPALTDVTLSKGLTSLEDYMFSGCSSLAMLIIPDNIRRLEYDVLCESGIRCLIICGELEYIRSFRTESCPNLEQIIFLSSPPENPFGFPDEEAIGIAPDEEGRTRVCYTKAFKSRWAPNGETEWMGFPLTEYSGDPSALTVCAD